MPKSFVILSLSVLFLLNACVYYQRYRLPEQRLFALKSQPLNYYLVDPAHPQTGVWYISRTQVEDTQVSGQITRMTENEGQEITYVRNRQDAQWSKNDVLIYPEPAFMASLPEQGPVILNIENIEKIEVYEVNQVKSFIAPLITVLGLMILISGLG